MKQAGSPFHRFGQAVDHDVPNPSALRIMQLEPGAMTDRRNPDPDRRAILRALTLAGGAAIAATAPLAPAEAAADRKTANGRARYQPNSADVQNYYRVNRYPKK
jgi:hypothetical protein